MHTRWRHFSLCRTLIAWCYPLPSPTHIAMFSSQTQAQLLPHNWMRCHPHRLVLPPSAPSPLFTPSFFRGPHIIMASKRDAVWCILSTCPNNANPHTPLDTPRSEGACKPAGLGPWRQMGRRDAAQLHTLFLPASLCLCVGVWTRDCRDPVAEGVCGCARLHSAPQHPAFRAFMGVQ